MVETQEIVERSFYFSILKKLISEGYTLNPEDYQPATAASSAQFKADLAAIQLDKGYYISLFGAGNNQSKGEKLIPRIVINPKGWLPGDIGLVKEQLVKDADRYFVSEFPFESVDQFFDIHLVANTQEMIRMMAIFLQQSIPTRGYVKPYIYDTVPFDGNIFVEIVNFYDNSNLDKGIIEKVYQYQAKDTILDSVDLPDTLTPIKDITMMLGFNDEPLNELIHVQS